MAMSIMAVSSRPVTGGVDTHKDTHVAAVIDHLGGVLATESFETNAPAYSALLEWMREHGTLERIGVEGTGSYGAGLARFLSGEGVAVVEVNRPNRAVRRRAGKSDTVDAIEAARAALSGRAAGIPKSGDGTIEAIRMLRTTRRSAIQSRTQCANQIHALVDTAPESLRVDLVGQKLSAIIAIVGNLEVRADIAEPESCAPFALRGLATRWSFLDDQITELDSHLDYLVALAAPSLVAQFGVGTDTAGALLVAAGDNPERLRCEAAFAALCGVSPLPASSGKTNRHRLNRGGNREANSALWRIAIVRMSHHPATRAYVERRTEEGLSKREIIRCLKRYIARQLFAHLAYDFGISEPR
jgi:transposase